MMSNASDVFIRYLLICGQMSNSAKAISKPCLQRVYFWQVIDKSLPGWCTPATRSYGPIKLYLNA